MSKMGSRPDWSDWNGKSYEPEDPRSRPVTKDCHKAKTKPTEEELRKDAIRILEGFKIPGVAQATDEQLFGHLVKSKEEIAKMDNDWQNFFNNFFSLLNKKVEEKPTTFASGKSFIESLSKEEKAQYDKSVREFDSGAINGNIIEDD